MTPRRMRSLVIITVTALAVPLAASQAGADTPKAEPGGSGTAMAPIGGGYETASLHKQKLL